MSHTRKPFFLTSSSFWGVSPAKITSFGFLQVFGKVEEVWLTTRKQELQERAISQWDNNQIIIIINNEKLSEKCKNYPNIHPPWGIKFQYYGVTS